MTLRLHVAAHHPEAHLRLAVFHQETGNDGVKGPLASRHHVRMCWVDAEAVAAVLQADAGARHHHAAAEAHVVALDQADHHAALVGGGQVDRAALGRPAVLEVARLFRVDQPGAFFQVRLIQQVARRHRGHRTRVGDPAVGVGEGQLHRFDLQVLRLDAVHRQAADVERFQQAKRHQRRDALAVRWNLMHAVARVVVRDRVHPVGLVAGQVARRHAAAVRRRMGFQRLRDLAAVVGLALGVGDLAQRLARVGHHEAFTRRRRAPMRHEGLREAGQFFEHRHLQAPFVRDDARHAVAAFGEFDGRCQQVGERQPAVAFRQRCPAGHRARNRDAVPAAHRHAAAVFALEVFGVPCGRRHARRVQALQPLAVPENREQVAAQAVRYRLDDRQRRRGGDHRVDRVAALQQHAQACRGRQRLRSRDDVARHQRAADRRVGVGPLEGHGDS